VGLTGVIEISAGTTHTCARTANGSLWCWGNNADGELGDGTDTNRPTPVEASLANVTSVASGNGFTCATTADATHCFGRNDHGQLPGIAAAKGTVMVAPEAYASLSAGDAHACGIANTGAARCWGSNTRGQIGNGGVAPSSLPDGPAGTYTKIAAGGAHTCGFDADGMACWGRGDLGQLGNFVLADRFSPVRPTLSPATGMGAGKSHVCVHGDDYGGWVQCFGDNAHGESGVGGWNRIQVPMIGVPGLGLATMVDGGDAFYCALSGGAVNCWGDNSRGQLGLGTYSRSLTPIDVIIP
jgi:alpha-tubulin suppressor-like RCC1 family protein